MTLTQACAISFDSGDRNRGSDPQLLQRVQIQDAGDRGALAIVDGSRSEYLVGIDLTDASEGVLGVHCECPRYFDGYLCKHLWGALSKLEQLYRVPHTEIAEFDIYDVDPAEIAIGNPLNKKLRRKPSKPSPDKLGTKKRSGNKANWKSALQRIHNANYQSSVATKDPVRNVFAEAQHWFVLSVGDPANESSLIVSLMRSTRKQDRQWSRPVAVHLSGEDIAKISSDAERTALAMMTPVEEASSYQSHYSNRAGSARLFLVEPTRLSDTLCALHSTGRFAWKLGDSRQHFEDARTISKVFTDEFRLTLNLDSNSENPTQLRLRATLNNSQHSVEMNQLIWASKSGCALIHLPTENTADSNTTFTQELLAGTPPAHESDSIHTAIIHLDPSEMDLLQGWQQANTVAVPKRSLKSLLSELSDTQACLPINIDASLNIASVTGTPQAKCFLQQQESGESTYDVTLTVGYGEKQIPFDSDCRWWFDSASKSVIHRDLPAESRFIEAIPPSEFDCSFDDSFLSLEVPPPSFLRIVETLQTAGWEVTANGARLRLASDFNIEVESGMDWFDLNAEADFDGNRVCLPELLRAMRRGQKTVLLDDGSEGMLPEEWLNQFVDAERTGEEQGDSIRFKMCQGLMLDLMLQQTENVKRDLGFKKFIKKIESFDGIRPAKPTGTFVGELREYQQVGLGWFHFLQQFKFGGCLADDMGLGKTIQVLALLEKRRSRRIPKGEKRKPSIVIVPKSLVFNWIEEAAKFTPKLRLLNYTGSDRNTELKAAEKRGRMPHLLVTTYGTLRNDAPLLHEKEFDYVILDEAQAIKNPNSQAAKASRLLNGDHRLAMTGTPVENRLGDLWSLFEFLNPGMLDPRNMGCGSCGGANRLPNLEDEDSRRRIEDLGRSLRPFILRRTKEEVLPELPEKVEQTIQCEMERKQKRMYNELRTYYRAQLGNAIEEVGLKRAKIHVLEALLRLRQAACDPRLVKPDCNVRGAKIGSLLEQLDEIVGEGHKALVFSQFTTLLGLLREDLDKRKWNYEYLDGKTRRRAARVERFQTDEDCPLFLISLKAGGTGLNLTAADYVFILDPWWNPAVEAQAVDRAHRIGQTKSVNAYRMVCTDTVEDKIIELQQSKRNLADAIISQEKSLISDLTAEDLQRLLG